MASAGGNDCNDGERTIITIAAEKKPENLITQSIFTLRRLLRFFLLDLKSKRSAKKREEIEEIRNARVPLLRSARVQRKRGRVINFQNQSPIFVTSFFFSFFNPFNRMPWEQSDVQLERKGESLPWGKRSLPEYITD